MRAERLLRILLLLQVHGQMTARELAGRLDTSTRTIQRDLDTLSLAGIPVYATRGRAGGWTLAPDYRTRLTGLTPAEAMTVFVGTTAHVLADLGLADASASAHTKLLSALPSHARRDAEYAQARVLVDHEGWSGIGEAAEPWLVVVRQGLWEERRIRLTYGSSGTDFLVSPLGLVAKGRTWYLVAARDDGEIRTYRMQRVGAAVLTEETFTRPADFDLASHWADACAEFFANRPVFPVQLRVRTDALSRLSWAPSTTVGATTDDPDGWSQVEMTFENPFEARMFLLGMAGDAEVIAPPELRSEMRLAAERLVDVHADDGTP
ncbi:MAG: helix-turn-helix transcriptional regulator [Actinopolymorphaceae bacterium]